MGPGYLKRPEALEKQRLKLDTGLRQKQTPDKGSLANSGQTRLWGSCHPRLVTGPAASDRQVLLTGVGCGNPKLP